MSVNFRSRLITRWSKTFTSMQRLLLLILLGLALVGSVASSATAHATPSALQREARAADPPPIPLPRECGGVTPPGQDPPACCMFGYIYHDNVTVEGVSVRIESPQGVFTATTTSGGSIADPYYGVALSYPPLYVTVGTLITITASYSDMVSARTWTAQSEGQQVDLGLISGYQAPGPVSLP